MSFYEDFIEEGHACASCLEFFFDDIDKNGVCHGVGFPRLCKRCEQAEEDSRVKRNERDQTPKQKPKNKRR